jgi:hypothetical protein
MQPRPTGLLVERDGACSVFSTFSAASRSGTKTRVAGVSSVMWSPKGTCLPRPESRGVSMPTPGCSPAVLRGSARTVFDPAMSESIPPATFVLRYVPDIQEVSELLDRRLRTGRRESFRKLITALGFMAIFIAIFMADPSGPHALLPLLIGGFFASAIHTVGLLMRTSPRRSAARARSVHLELSEAYEVMVSVEGISSRIRHLTTI